MIYKLRDKNTTSMKRRRLLMIEPNRFTYDLYRRKLKDDFLVLNFDRLDINLVDRVIGLKPDLICLEIVTPGVFSGFEAINLLKANSHTKVIPIAVLTCQNTEKEMETSKKLGVIAYLSKSTATPREVANHLRMLI